MDYLYSSTPETSGNHRVPLMEFSGMEPLIEGFKEAVSEPAVRLFRSDVEPAELKNWDVATIVPSRFEGEKGVYSLTRFRRILPRYCRGKIIRPWMGEVMMAVLMDNQQYVSCRLIVAYVGNTWIDAGQAWSQPNADRNRYRERGDKAMRQPIPWRFLDRHLESEDDDLLLALRVSLGVAEDWPRHWRVLLGRENRPAISFVTDPHGAMDVFRLRDIPEGRKRRAALRHWVTEHWRQTRSGGETKVRDYLRGAVDFTWNGLIVKIVPSVSDRIKNLETVESLPVAQIDVGPDVGTRLVIN